MAYIPEDARWYLADVILEHRVDGEPDSVVHINLHLVEASSPEEAYRKAIDLGRSGEDVYLNTDGREVRTTFRGLRNLFVVHDELEDGAELIYDEYVGLSEEEVQGYVTAKNDLAVFAPRRPRFDGPNYMPDSVMQKLKEAGYEPEADQSRTPNPPS